MHRTEVIAKTSGAHLGHVFGDAPGGRRRFCINATVLEFVPRAELPKWRKTHHLKMPTEKTQK
jgi:peptide methionine sulfoxide reductase msrA/msrB